MITDKYLFELKSNLSELDTLCEHLNKFGHVAGLSEACVTDINICLDELFTNIISYGFPDNLEHLVRFTINVDKRALIVEIEDKEIPFNPLEKKDPEPLTDLMDAKIGGLGIHIVRKLMDDIFYKRDQGKNKLTVKKLI